MSSATAYYDKARGELCFGYYQADNGVTGRNLPGGVVFTCLSHDIIAHEVTHALLDGLRAHFNFPSSPDVLAFHEAFADLIAIFQHFQHEKLLANAINRSGGDLREPHVLHSLAEQFGHTTGSGRALRSALLEMYTGEMPDYKTASLCAHERGSVLVSAVFEAFFTLYERKTRHLLQLATGGTGQLPDGDMPTTLRDALVRQAKRLADQFLNICIRAVDCCPPVGIRFDDYLRAVITADFDLIPEDPWAYREAWIDAFATHGIYPDGVTSLSEEAVLWRTPGAAHTIEALSFSKLTFGGDPARPASKDELARQAKALGTFITQPKQLAAFGLAPAGRAEDGGHISAPCIESIRTLRRVGPGGQVAFDLVAEVTQKRTVRDGDRCFTSYGGATVILGAEGRVRYIIGKNVMNKQRLDRQKAFMASELGERYWRCEGAQQVPAANLFQMLHQH